MRMRLTVMAALLFAVGSLWSSVGLAGITPSLGNTTTAPQLTQSFDLTCPQGRVATGIEVSSTTTVRGIRVRCTPRAADGRSWADPPNHTFTAWSPMTNLQLPPLRSQPNQPPTPQPVTSGDNCPANFYIVSFNVYLTTPPSNTPLSPMVALNRSMKRIRIICRVINEFGMVTGAASNLTWEEAGADATGGAWAAPNNQEPTCPVKGIANGARGRSVIGSLKILAFTCVEPSQLPFTALEPTFLHPRCVNCHAVVAENFQIDGAPPLSDAPPNPAGGLPSGHPVTNATTNNNSTQNGQGCRVCHRDELLPAQGTINPGWHAPTGGNASFRDDNAGSLGRCLSGQGGSPTALAHLTQDKLVLWAIADGRIPDAINQPPNRRRPTAPPHDLQTWLNAVNAWAATGFACQ